MASALEEKEQEIAVLRQQLEEAQQTIATLESSNQTYQKVINHLPHYYVFWKDEHCRFLGASLDFANKAGFASVDELIGKTDFDCSWGHQAKAFQNIDHMVLKQDLPEYQNVETQTLQDGSEIWLKTTKCAVHGPDGTVSGLVGVSEDITERRRLNQMLKESEQRFRQFSEATFEGVAIHQNGVIEDANPILAKMFHYDPEELVGRHLVDLNTPEFHALIQEKIEAGDTAPFRSVGLKKNSNQLAPEHRTIDVEITLRDNPVQAIAIRDISDQMRIERLKDEFLANTSHELRTPLNGIIGIAESLIEGAAGHLSPKVLENLSMITSSGKRLYNLVNDILDYSKMRQQSLDLQLKAVDLHSLADIVTALTQPLIGDKPVELLNCVPTDLPAVKGDENRLQQVLYNLIGNAIKFTAQGEVRVEALERQGGVELTVSDTGIGIPNSKQKQIFQSFQQADSSTSREYGGTGLGLTVSQQLVRLHGGNLEVANNPMRGSRFFFSLDIAEDRGTEHLISTQQSHPQTFEYVKNFLGDSVEAQPRQKMVVPQGEGQCILVIDDEMVNLKVILNFLELHHYRVLVAQSGFQALDLLKVEQPDLILLDIMMPRMDGYELCEIIRRSYDAWLLPIIFLTAKNQISDLTRGLNSGANDFLTKPFAQEELLSRVKTHLRLKESVETLKENQQLKTEIVRRRKAELELDHSKKRLAKLLDLSDDVILAINENHEIVYFNQQAEQTFGYSTPVILGKTADLLIADQDLEVYRQSLHHSEKQALEGTAGKYQTSFQWKNKEGEAFVQQASIHTFELDDEHIFAFVLTRPEEPKAPPVVEIPKEERTLSSDLIEELLVKKQAVRSMEGLFDNVLTYLIEGGNELIPQLRAVGEELSEDISGVASSADSEEFRQALVDVMQYSIQTWETVTNKKKFELAEESDLWKVYIDNGVFKTRTMDKYLKLEKLPVRPKWNKVVDTAEYVVEQCSPSNQVVMHRLQESLAKLNVLIASLG